jgi:uncharacterized protein YydD (DUF2326 family)
MKRLLPLRWLGTLLTPAEDPRRGDAALAGPSDPEAILAELRRSRAELAQLRGQIEGRTPDTRIAQELADQEHELLAAEHHLLLSVDERAARAALLTARYRAAEAEVQSDA